MKQAAVIGCMALAAFASANGNLVSNGGFETGDLTDWSVNSTVDTFVTGSFYLEPYEGDYQLITGPAFDATISQMLPTITGDTYTLSYEFAQTTGSSSSDYFYVLLNGALVQSDGNADVGWTPESYVFTATGPTALTFEDSDPIGWYHVDAVSVTGVSSTPAPVAGLSFILGAAARRRRLARG